MGKTSMFYVLPIGLFQWNSLTKIEIVWYLIVGRKSCGMELADNNKSRDNMSTNTNDRSTMNLQQKLMEHGEDHMRIDRKLDNMNAINEDTYQKGTEALSNLQK